MKITHYFDWEGGPAVVGEVEPDVAHGYYMQPDDVDWVQANNLMVLDFFNDGRPLSEESFQNEYGIIGEDLPELPT